MASSYYSEDRPRRHRSQRDRRPRDYAEEETYISRGGVDPRDARRMDLVPRRRDDSISSIEEIERDFAPGDGGYVKRKTTVREGVRPSRRARSAGRYDDGFYDDRRSEYSGRRKHDRRDRRSRRNDDYSDESSPSRSPPRRRDSMAEKALTALGLGGAAGALNGLRSRSRSRGPQSYAGSRASSRGRRARSRYSSRSRSRSRSKGDVNAKVMQAVKAALAAGAAEAVRARKEPGGWSGDKGKRILTAAIGAAGVDGLIDRDPDKHSKRHIVESALAGLATNRIVNGPRSRSRGPGRGRSGERSQSRGGVKDLAAGGILAAAGKSIYNRVRSKSRGRGRGRSESVSSYSSYDSRSPPRREKKRSKSISDMARKGMAALGIGEAAKEEKRRSRRDSYSSDEDDYPRDVGQPRSMASASGPPESSRWETEPHHFGDPNTDSDSDLGSSTDEERKHKKSRNRQILTTGLATVATIHAAHNVHQSMIARDERHKLVKEGELSSKEARKEKQKARLQDVAAIGIAALGIKGAISEWKEVKEQRAEYHEEAEKAERHRQKRAARRAKMLQMQHDGLLPNGYGNNSSFSNSAPNLHNNAAVYNPYIPPQYQANSANGSNIFYHDDNPYAASGGLSVSQGPSPVTGYNQSHGYAPAPAPGLVPSAPTPPNQQHNQQQQQQPLRQQRTGQ